MPEFLKLLSPTDALSLLMTQLPEDVPLRKETIASEAALDRVLATPVRAPHPLPPFRRSTVDGYALRAKDTFGASQSLPAYLKLIGEVPMGASADIKIGAAQAAVVHTGGMLPNGCDAVVMLEDTQRISEEEIEVLRPLGVGQHVLNIGEDVGEGDVVLEAGTPLRPQEIGGLMALGIEEVIVAAPPRVGILSTGDEIVDPKKDPNPGQVRDVNSYTLSALVCKSGGVPIRYGVIPDNLKMLEKAARQSHEQDDIVVITAGSSVSARDMTAQVIASLGDPGVLVHGIAMRPGKPTILACADGIPTIGLPGNPVSALVVGGLFLAPVIRHLLGLRGSAISPSVPARMSVNIASETGREDYLPVQLNADSEGLQAEPVYGRSNLIFTLVRADGLVRIPPEATGLDAGQPVEVLLF
jgi:molybdopterin molybdotransferase